MPSVAHLLHGSTEAGLLHGVVVHDRAAAPRGAAPCEYRAGADLVAAARQAMAGHAGKRLDSAGVDLIEFGDPVEDAVQLADELFLPVLGNIDPREAGDPGNGGLVNRHDAVLFPVAEK